MDNFIRYWSNMVLVKMDQEEKITVRPHIEVADWQFINGKRKPGESFRECFHRLLGTYRATINAVYKIAQTNFYHKVLSYIDDFILAGEL